MRILVTGGAGFIGSHLARTLVGQGHDVIVLDDLSTGQRENIPEQAEFIEGDIRLPQTIDILPEKIDIIYHLAAQMDVRVSVAEPVYDTSVNVLGTVAMLDYAVKAGASRFIFASSGGAVYGGADAIPTPETADKRSSSPYGLAKACAESYIQLFTRLHGLRHVILRYANVYGPGQNGSKESGVVAIFCQRALSSSSLTIFGDGKQTRDFVYIDDVTRANLAALEKGQNETVNIGTSKETLITELADKISELASVTVEFQDAKPGEERRSCLDITKAKEVLGWEPSIELDEGLRRTFEATKAEK